MVAQFPFSSYSSGPISSLIDVVAIALKAQPSELVE